MQRIKVFGIYSTDILQEKIDEWFVEHPDIKVEQMTQSSDKYGNVRISILYSFEKPKIGVKKICKLCKGSGVYGSMLDTICPLCGGVGTVMEFVDKEEV